ncbi:GNAT family N-acetyltransferase [Xenorhabdus bovienii]|uniref:GNAT family N-acetyltransferase n=1 Tax=Xenorhabdus bovienii TaxID=40576 RepID=A0AAJ1J973_XENBV|nr:GNAT family N-acetyltransferase [Xenorhabdus bovienii]MDE1477658.1 GNAT family N-acetyltransferase [Xenorhabdus bovienii]MDE1485792.1 GNAT family N-acetyltransferase [Xenorhabdus bovienii]MDE1490600.1 GNAT family N-acetyltransferase [Xenorhabdus bovienii]MDE1493946.1 GNAT family N-acetyltransferase [Xenorhabdus bovienii]MDE9427003.1 GNAT family N-acetyltransferase [Xenorhabdus bovienii]
MEITVFYPEHIEALRILYLESRKVTFTWLNTDNYQLTDFDKDTEGEMIYIAVENGKVLGFISVWVQNHFIHHLYVSTESHRCGIGTQLLDFVKSKYPHQLSLKCLVKNHKAVNFYEFNGFIKKAKSSDELAGNYYLMVFSDQKS